MTAEGTELLLPLSYQAAGVDEVGLGAAITGRSEFEYSEYKTPNPGVLAMTSGDRTQAADAKNFRCAGG